ncbi:MAG: hypothetical protein K2I30_00990 [Clostridia bacterium]|nr:hypothetical protein [Clostridia bacterium]
MEIVSNYQCYRYNGDLYLIDLTLNIYSDKIDWNEMNVPEDGVEPMNWQVPYLEQYLTLDGIKKICELYDEPSPPVNPCRVVFFLYKCGGKVLHTPYGNFPLMDTLKTPKHLKKIVEFDEED